MKTRYYRFAGIEIQITMPAKMMYEDERRLAPFAVSSVTDPHIFQYELTEVFPKPTGNCIASLPNFQVYSDGDMQIRYIGSVSLGWENAYIRAIHKDKEHLVQLKSSQYPNKIGTHTVLDTLTVEHLVAKNDGFILHCSYIDYHGKAILFTAPSETGKSTQADLWHQYRNADIINGDRAVIRCIDGKLYAEGFPYSGSSNYCENRSLPLCAIVYLGQAPVTSIRKLRGYEAFAKIWEGISVNTWDKEDMDAVSSLTASIAETIPVYHLPCTPTLSAVETLHQELERIHAI